MSKLIWDEVGEKFYETGVRNGVLYPMVAGAYPLGVPWNGLTGITESPSGAESTPLYADDIKYLNLMSVEEFGATIEAYTYPDEFAICDGSAELAVGVMVGQQARKAFGLSYRTVVGNDVEGESLGYKLHLIYGAMASPSEKSYSTVNDSPEAITFSWALTTTPVAVLGKKPTATLVIDSTKASPAIMTALEVILFGDIGVDPRMPLPDEIAALFAAGAPPVLSLVSILPDDDAVAQPVASNIVFTFNNKILRESIVVTTAAGVIVPGSKVWDGAGKVLTFDPTVNLTAATSYVVTIGGLVDVYGQALASSVKNFVTA